LTVHPTKTRIVPVQSEGFDFLGWHFRGHQKWPRLEFGPFLLDSAAWIV
jgi:hypothetical protein